jgi:hypothetical protein
MTEIVEVYGREFEIAKPKPTHYLNLLHFVGDLAREGYADQVVELSKSEDMGGIEWLFRVVETINEEQLAKFAAVLLQDDVEGTVEFIEENGGVELGWLMEAFAVNCELADLGQVVESFRRARQAIRSWRTKAD